MGLLDCGRLDPGSPSVRLFEDAEVQVVGCRPSLAAVHHLQARLRAIDSRRARLLAIGERPYAPDALAAACGIPLLGSLPLDARAAETLGDGPALSARALGRSDRKS